MRNKVDTEMNDEIRPEYDLSQLKGGVRGKYVQRYNAGTNLVHVGVNPFPVRRGRERWPSRSGATY